jgi:hypothetical protein
VSYPTLDHLTPAPSNRVPAALHADVMKRDIGIYPDSVNTVLLTDLATGAGKGARGYRPVLAFATASL